jgi:hypothetical protein
MSRVTNRLTIGHIKLIVVCWIFRFADIIGYFPIILGDQNLFL